MFVKDIPSLQAEWALFNVHENDIDLPGWMACILTQSTQKSSHILY